MSEQGPEEIQNIAERDEVRLHVNEAVAQVEKDMKDPVQHTADAAGEVGFFSALGNIAQERMSNIKAIKWKDAKATVAALLSLAPALGTVANLSKTVEAGKGMMQAGKAAKAAGTLVSPERAAWMERVASGIAKRKFIESVKQVPNVAHVVREPISATGRALGEGWGVVKELSKAERSSEAVAAATQGFKKATKEAGKAIGLSWIHRKLHQLDPFPDVPTPLAVVAGFAQWVLPGADLVPSLWQLTHNKLSEVKEYIGMGIDVGKLVGERIGGKFKAIKQPDVARAATVFPVLAQV